MILNSQRSGAFLVADLLAFIFFLASNALAQSRAELYVPPPPGWQQAITALQTVAGTNRYNFSQWAWLWQRSPAFPSAPASFEIVGSLDNTPGLNEEIIVAGDGNGSQRYLKNLMADFLRFCAICSEVQRPGSTNDR